MHGPFARLFRDQYTGAQRCRACTVVNAALLAVVTATAAVVWWPAAVVLAAVGTAAIVFNGYLVPGTPVFAPALVALLPGDPFHAAPPDESDALGGDVDGERVVDALVAAGVLTEDADGLHLDEAFRDRWREEMRTVRDGDLVAAIRTTAPTAERVKKVTADREWFVLSGGGIESETWLARPVAIAEVAAVRALADRDVAHEVAVAAATPLRAFLAQCPVCDGPVEQTTSTACCGGGVDPHEAPEDEILACVECDERLFTF
ncbi:hypothetical protein ACFQH6_16290 [Halobacteriaceae archaeon GCM10025711]